jgi:hypothetical protein
MDASFRPKNTPLGLLIRRLALPLLLALSAGAVLVSLTHPRSHNPIFAAIFFGGFPLGLAGVVYCELRFFERQKLAIRGHHIRLCGVFQRREIDLNEVTEARWLPFTGLSLRSPSVKLVIVLHYYERPEQEEIIHHLHSAIDVAAQTDWNLFAYKRALHVPRPKRTKPGPGEVLVTRARYDRLLLPAVLVSGLVGIVAWRMAGRGEMAIVPLVFPVGLWLLLRYSTPAEGDVQPSLSSMRRTNPHSRFMFNGIALLFVGMMLIGLLWRFLRYPEVLLVSFMLLWTSFLVWECEKESRRKARQDRELADLAAKDRGEPRADTWGGETI